MKVGDLVIYKSSRTFKGERIYGIITRLGKASANCELRVLFGKYAGKLDWRYLSDLEVISESR